MWREIWLPVAECQYTVLKMWCEGRKQWQILVQIWCLSARCDVLLRRKKITFSNQSSNQFWATSNISAQIRDSKEQTSFAVIIWKCYCFLIQNLYSVRFFSVKLFMFSGYTYISAVLDRIVPKISAFFIFRRNKIRFCSLKITVKLVSCFAEPTPGKNYQFSWEKRCRSHSVSQFLCEICVICKESK